MTRKRPENGDGPGTSPATPTPIRRRLDTHVRIRREMVTLYRAARAGEINPADATRLGWLLMAISKMVEVDAIEARLQAIEDRLDGRGR